MCPSDSGKEKATSLNGEVRKPSMQRGDSLCYLERKNSKYINIQRERMASLRAICLRQNIPDTERDET